MKPEDTNSQINSELNLAQPNTAPPTTLPGGQKVIQPSPDFAQELEKITQSNQPAAGIVGGTGITPAPSVPEAAPASGQLVQPPTSSSWSQLPMPTEQKPSKWRYFFIVLGILQLLGVALFFVVMTSVAGKTGSEFIALALFATLVPAVALIAFINLLGLPIYMAKHKNLGKGMVFSVLSLLVSAVLALYGAYSVYQFYVAVPKQINELNQRSKQEFAAKQQAFDSSNSKPEITKDEAVQLLKSCKLKGFYYTNQTDKRDPANGGWGELSTTGVVLTKVDGQPYRISIADKLIPELVPIARQAQKSCGAPQFWHDGNYEQFHDGHWYFGSTVVN